MATPNVLSFRGNRRLVFPAGRPDLTAASLLDTAVRLLPLVEEYRNDAGEPSDDTRSPSIGCDGGGVNTSSNTNPAQSHLWRPVVSPVGPSVGGGFYRDTRTCPGSFKKTIDCKRAGCTTTESACNTCGIKNLPLYRFGECGHGCLCIYCADTFRSCPVCRVKVSLVQEFS